MNAVHDASSFVVSFTSDVTSSDFIILYLSAMNSSPLKASRAFFSLLTSSLPPITSCLSQQGSSEIGSDLGFTAWAAQQ